MAIHIDDYKIAQSRWNGAGLIPYHLADARVADTARLTGSAISAVDGAARLTEEISKVVSVGNKSEFDRGLEQFHDDALREFAGRDDYDQFEESWNDAVTTKLPGYLSGKTKGLDADEVKRSIAKMSEQGREELLAMAKIGMLRKSRQAWEQSLTDAEQKGDEGLVGKILSEGKGVFIAPDQEENVARQAQANALKTRLLRDARADPLEAMKGIERGDHPALGNVDLESEVIPEARRWSERLKSEYGKVVLSIMENEGRLDEGDLKLGISKGLVSKELSDSYRLGQERERRCLLNGEAPTVSDRELGEWMSKIAEYDGSEGEAGRLSLELACSGLPRDVIKTLSSRMRLSAEIPLEVRQNASRQLRELYQRGAWGVAGDDESSAKWRENQQKVFEIYQDYGDEGIQRILNFVREKKDEDDNSWVAYGDIKEKRSRNNKSGK